ncbi:MAG: AAA family ATPase [Gammaproteobacteria bacterium]
MKIRTLYLTAFGPFTERALTFEAPGLHIVYGPNEAGKSSALRGLKALLYGIDERTLDNFIHSNDKLRIGGHLETADHRELVFVRRKGRKNTVLSSEGKAMDEKALAPFLHGVTPELFASLFGIDHQALVQGGNEILEQKGEVGQALFSAALGSHALHAVLNELDESAKILFLPSGSKPLINAAIRTHLDLKAEIKKCSLSAREWDQHRRAWRGATDDLQKIQAELTVCRTEVNRLQRIQRVLPKLSRRRELIQEREGLGEVVVLHEDFSERRRKAINALETAQTIVAKATPRLEGYQQQREGLSIHPAVLEQAENIAALHARLGAYRKAQQDRPQLEAETQQFVADAVSILKTHRPDLALTPDGKSAPDGKSTPDGKSVPDGKSTLERDAEFQAVEQLRPVLARRQAITDLGSQAAVLKARVEQAESSLRETEQRLKTARAERDDIAESGPTDALHRAILAARKQGDLDALIQTTQRQLASLQVTCVEDLARLTLWDGALEDVATLALPSRESIHQFEVRYAELLKRTQRLEEKKDAIIDELQEFSQALDEIGRVGDVPTETALLQARAERDAVWQLLRRQWVMGEDVSEERIARQADGVLPDTFEHRLTDADDVSDRLRREADRVHKLASLQARQASSQQQAQQLDEQLDVINAEKTQLDSDWQALWAQSHITPRTPPEMRVWQDTYEKLRDQVGQRNVLSQKVTELELDRRTHIQRLNDERGVLENTAQKTVQKTMGNSLSTPQDLEHVLLECEALVHQLDEAHRKRDTLNQQVKVWESDIAALKKEHALATAAHQAWQLQWAEQMQRVGLRSEASPAELDDYFENLRTLFSKLGEVEKLRIRIAAIHNEETLFRAQVATLVNSLAPELATLSADDAVIRLNALLSENRSRQTKRQQIEEQIQQAQQEIQDSNVSIQAMKERLDALCVEAKCDNPAELEVVERRSVDFLRLKGECESIEQAILDAGEGSTIAALEAQAERIDPDSLPGRIAELITKIEEELEPKRTALAEAKGRKEKEVELMDGSDRAVALADQAKATVARIRSDAERYIRAKLAGKILRDQIERYRQENQGPLLKRASEHFSALTLDSFDGLLADFNERDEPVLIGLRSGGGRVAVEGMSSGTRDQLYLALRLASLEKYMGSSEPMPFIVDDILVDFDDARSQAALKALATLAEKTQVILFTHHARVVEQAKQVGGAVQAHEL